MRYAIMVAAFGMLLGAPVLAPTMLMNAAIAQASEVVDPAEAALAAELAAVAGDADAIAAIVAREQGLGNTNVLARALVRAARAVAFTNSAGAAALGAQAVAIAAGADEDTQAVIGVQSADLVTTLLTVDPAGAATVQTAVAMSPSVAIQITYASGGASGGGLPTGSITPPGGGGSGPPPPPPGEGFVIPVPPEPNPSQSGSPV